MTVIIDVKDSGVGKKVLNKPTPWYFKVASTLVFVIVLFLLVTRVAQANYIPSESMSPTLIPDDRIIVEKVTIKLSEPHRGSLIVFHPPVDGRESELWVKRLIGLPGETIEIRDGSIYIDGSPLNENYTLGKTKDLAPVTLAEDNPGTNEDESEYYFLGDNREHSMDSRHIGPLKRGNLVGKVILRYWPISKIGTM